MKLTTEEQEKYSFLDYTLDVEAENFELLSQKCGFPTTSECRKAINELENPILKEKRYGGGVRKCEKCGELINGSMKHNCPITKEGITVKPKQ